MLDQVLEKLDDVLLETMKELRDGTRSLEGVRIILRSVDIIIDVIMLEEHEPGMFDAFIASGTWRRLLDKDQIAILEGMVQNKKRD